MHDYTGVVDAGVAAYLVALSGGIDLGDHGLFAAP